MENQLYAVAEKVDRLLAANGHTLVRLNLVQGVGWPRLSRIFDLLQYLETAITDEAVYAV